MSAAAREETGIASFGDLLHAARSQPEPQRLLFVFTVAELPADSTPGERRRFAEGRGGALVPMMCVDKTPEELDSFERLESESRALGQAWSIVFVAALSGRAGCAPATHEARAPMDRMVDAIKAGSLASFLAFDRGGQPVSFE